jgi:hypothetical protein
MVIVRSNARKFLNFKNGDVAAQHFPPAVHRRTQIGECPYPGTVAVSGPVSLNGAPVGIFFRNTYVVKVFLTSEHGAVSFAQRGPAVEHSIAMSYGRTFH